MGGPALPIALGVGGQLLSGLGNQKGANTGVATPPDLMGARGQQTDILNYLLGGAKGAEGIGGDPTQRLQTVFGNYQNPLTSLQRSSAGGMEQMQNANSPAMSALNTAFPALQNMLTGTGPQFERDIASANQQGERFGSGNEILRGEALRNLYNQRSQTASTIGMLGGQQAGIFGQGAQVGAQQAGQADLQTQRTLQLLGGLLGLRQQMTAGLPITQTPNTKQTLGSALGGGSMLAGVLGGGGGGTNALLPGGSAGVPTSNDIANQIPGWAGGQQR